MPPADPAALRTVPHDGPGAARHDELSTLAERVLPGGRAGGYVLPDDVRFIVRRGAGARLEDVRGRRYIDWVCGAGVLILGHAHPDVVAAVQAQAANGLHYFGTLNEPALRLAERLVEAIPCAERIAFATTGSEATFYAMRIARAATGRDRILKCEGGYHGNHDYSNISVAPARPSNYPAGRPDSAGIPAGARDSVLVAPFNDLDTIRRIVEAQRGELAAVIVEPVQRVVFPDDGFLAGLRRICDEAGVLLIFDEVVTGFRLAYGGAQAYFGVVPDLASYGKIIGGGTAFACVAGRADLIALCDPANKGRADYAYVNGTLHGNPMGAAAGLATLDILAEPGVYQRLRETGDALRAACQEVLDRHGLPARAVGRESFWQILFTDREPRSHGDIMAADMARTRALDHELLRRGVYVLPAMRRFVSAAHGEAEIAETARALDAACRALG